VGINELLVVKTKLKTPLQVKVTFRHLLATYYLKHSLNCCFLSEILSFNHLSRVTKKKVLRKEGNNRTEKATELRLLLFSGCYCNEKHMLCRRNAPTFHSRLRDYRFISGE
jgi:hypothetical protein